MITPEERDADEATWPKTGQEAIEQGTASGREFPEDPRWAAASALSPTELDMRLENNWAMAMDRYCSRADRIRAIMELAVAYNTDAETSDLTDDQLIAEANLESHRFETEYGSVEAGIAAALAESEQMGRMDVAKHLLNDAERAREGGDLSRAVGCLLGAVDALRQELESR